MWREASAAGVRPALWPATGRVWNLVGCGRRTPAPRAAARGRRGPRLGGSPSGGSKSVHGEREASCAPAAIRCGIPARSLELDGLTTGKAVTTSAPRQLRRFWIMPAPWSGGRQIERVYVRWSRRNTRAQACRKTLAARRSARTRARRRLPVTSWPSAAPRRQQTEMIVDVRQKDDTIVRTNIPDRTLDVNRRRSNVQVVLSTPGDASGQKPLPID